MTPKNEVKKRLKPAILDDPIPYTVQPIIIMSITMMISIVVIFFVFRARVPVGHHGVIVRNGKAIRMDPIVGSVIRTPVWDRLETLNKNGTVIREEFKVSLVDETQVGLALIVEVKFLKQYDLYKLIDLLRGRASNLRRLIIKTTVSKFQTGRLSMLDACMFQYMQPQNISFEILGLLKSELSSWKVDQYVYIQGVHVTDLEKIDRLILTTCQIEESDTHHSSAKNTTPLLNKSSTPVFTDEDQEIEISSSISSITQVTNDNNYEEDKLVPLNSKSDSIARVTDTNKKLENNLYDDWDDIFC